MFSISLDIHLIKSKCSYSIKIIPQNTQKKVLTFFGGSLTTHDGGTMRFA